MYAPGDTSTANADVVANNNVKEQEIALFKVFRWLTSFLLYGLPFAVVILKFAFVFVIEFINIGVGFFVQIGYNACNLSLRF